MEAFRFIVFRLVALLVIIYLVAIAYLYFNQEKLIFRPTILAKDYKYKFNADFEEINIPSFDGIKLNGLLFKSIEAKGLVFYLHGNAGALDSWGENAAVYTKLGYDFFILDYRGFGKSEGKIQSQDQFNKDISEAYKYLKTKYKESQIIIIGYSIGTGPAVILASKNYPGKLILQSPYYNFKELSSARFPFVPNFIKKYTFETDKHIEKVKAPIYIFHGDKDELIPFDNSIRLRKLFKEEDHLYLLKNQEHLGMNDNIEYQTELKRILN